MPFVKTTTKTAEADADDLHMSFARKEGGGVLCSVYVGNSDGSGQSTEVDVLTALTAQERTDLRMTLGKLRTVAMNKLGYVQQVMVGLPA